MIEVNHMEESRQQNKTTMSGACAVCEEVTDNHHLHYGAYCCLSCRAFFRRVNQKTKTKEYKCKKNGACDVSFKNRKSCQKCRFEKCLAIGMKSNLVLTTEQKKVRFRKKSSESKGSGSNVSLHDPGCIKRTFSVEYPTEASSSVIRQRTLSCHDFTFETTAQDLDLDSTSLEELEASLTSTPFHPEIDLTNLILESQLLFPTTNDFELFDQTFNEVPMGDEWLKEFIMFSFDVPLSKHFASTNFRTLMLRFQKMFQRLGQEEIWRCGSMKAATLWMLKSESLITGKDQLDFSLGQTDWCTWKKYYESNLQISLKKVSLVDCNHASGMFDSQEIVQYINCSVKLDNLKADKEVLQTMALLSLFQSSNATEGNTQFVMEKRSQYFALLKQKVRNVEKEERIMRVLHEVDKLTDTLSKLNMM